MKNAITYFALLILSSTLFSQNVKEIKVSLVKRDKVLEKLALEETLDKEDSIYFTELQNNEDYIEFSRNIFDHSAVSSHDILIQFIDENNQTMTISSANLSSIKIYGKSKTDIDITSKYVIIDLKEYLGDTPKNGEHISIEVSTNSGKKVTKWFRYINGWQGYNFLDNKFGLWFPTNMYSTSFERSDNGVRFTAMPIGLAIGGKYNISQKFYLGFSGTVNYTLSAAKNSNDEAESYLLQDFSIGPLIDLGGFAYLGYTFPVNLTNQEKQLKPQFVIGVGFKINELLIGKD
ncbi:hypothetical protein V6B16_10740 [Salinimicrobium catena]|uniref:hypothetical protein n=1 Tax=Salinimicrobium catena TaxID=390640 RepID=UPI002FE47E58